MIRLDFVIDAACVGLEDPIKGHLPVGFVVIDKSKSLTTLMVYISWGKEVRKGGGGGKNFAGKSLRTLKSKTSC